ncbi:caspase family protein [Leisingera sp. ANG59]|uniref:caspase family protein n=1 Tax=Leisingera sp. ANG59 TaxID=2675221 RepID=UPI0015735711|nr:caspase family protein [Leisingera sp. ANG59]NSY38259.1 YARHG domain-containing protein [Leisingera sp. ANG59]
MALNFLKALLLAVLPLVWSAPLAEAGRRIALVLGNSEYQNASYLPNAERDARDIAAALRGIGFEVHDGYNLGRRDTLRLAQQVTGQLREEDTALFYYSGHGVQLGAENFVLPVDVAGSDEQQLKAASVSLQAILREMELRAGRNIIVLDACRNNPFQSRMAARSLGGAARGLARVDAGVGSYIAFSTQPGNVALDGSGQNSPFTAALLRHITRHEDLHAMMRRVRADVVAETGGSQVPWENSSLIDEVYLAARGQAAPDPAAGGGAAVQAVPSGQIRPRAQQFDYRVSGLDPNGDGFLALRDGTTSGARRLAKMGEGTRLAVLAQRGRWLRVRTETGLEGWAHSNWIRKDAAASAAAPVAQNQCDALWFQRNSIFARRGYCFQSPRGQAAFSNAGCIPGMRAGDVPLSAAERAEVTRLKAQEQLLGCR